MSLYPGFGSQRWINTSGGIPYFSVPMPVERAATPAEQCGRFVNTGIHVVSGGNGGPFPSQCGTAALTPQEKAWEFLIFELVGLRDSRQHDADAAARPAARRRRTCRPAPVTQPPAPPPPPPPPPPPMVD